MNDALSSSPPLCPHFTLCGGCTRQDLTPVAYQEFKHQKISALLSLLNRSLETLHLHPLHSVPAGTRRRAVFKAFGAFNSVKLGFYQSQSHDLVSIQTCLVVTPLIENFLKPLKKFLKDSLKLKGKAEIFITHCDQGLDVSIERSLSTPLTLDQHQQSADLALSQNLARLTIDQDPLYTRVQPTVTFGGYPVSVTPRSFLQASTLSDKWLAEKVCQGLPSVQKTVSKKLKIADLFCGRGTLTLPLTEYGKMAGFDLEKDAVAALQKTAALAQLPIQAQTRNLFQGPLPLNELNAYDVVVLNPPREGAWAQSKILAQAKVSRLIMISCQPKTFMRDAKILESGNYILTDIFPFDQFLWSDHLEVVGFFDLKP